MTQMLLEGEFVATNQIETINVKGNEPIKSLQIEGPHDTNASRRKVCYNQSK